MCKSFFVRKFVRENFHSSVLLMCKNFSIVLINKEVTLSCERISPSYSSTIRIERINELKKYFDIIKKEHYNSKNVIINSKKDKILEYIECFKKDHKFRVMEKGIYPTFFLFQKNLENENYGICGWRRTNRCWEKNISHYEYEKKINYLHLTDEEKSF